MPFRLFILGLIALTSPGCGAGEATASGTGATAVEVRLGYFANVTHAQAVLGAASGDFASAVAPARFSTKVFNAGPSLVEALLAGNIDIGYVGPGPALNAHQKSGGEGIRVVAGAAANGVLIVARTDSGITAFKDLAGRRIATPQIANTQDVAARRYLIEVLGQNDANNVIAISNAEQAGMMARGEIDAAWAPEPWGSRLIIQNGARLIAREGELWPSGQFALTTVVTTPAFLAKHPQVVAKILAVHGTWTQRLKRDAQAYRPQLEQALFDLSGKKLPAGVLKASLENVQFTLDPMAQTFATMGRWSYDLGYAKSPPTLDGLIDTTLLAHQLEGSGATTRP